MSIQVTTAASTQIKISNQSAEFFRNRSTNYTHIVATFFSC